MAKRSHGTVINISVSSTMTPIPGVKDIEFNPGEWDEIDTTNHGSANEEELLKGIRRGKSISFDVQWDETDSAHLALESVFDSLDTESFQVVVASGDTFQFDGYVMSLTAPLPVSGSEQVRQVSIRISGQITKNPS